MKKFLEYSFTALIFIFFVLYCLILRYNASDSVTIYCIGMMIGAIVTSALAIVLNKCRKIQVKRFYKISFITLSVYLLLQAVSMLCVNLVHDQAFNVMTWILNFAIAIPISFIIFQLFYTVKDWFKKGYSLQSFDYQTMIMAINSIAYLIISIMMSKATSSLHADDPNAIVDGSYTVILHFDFNSVLYGLIYTSVAYLLLYITISSFHYYLYGRADNKR